MQRVALLFSVAVLAASAGRAQSFRPGYVVPISGDTLRGEVRDQGGQRNAQTAVFRPGPGAAPTEYQPAQLRGYGLQGGRQYEARYTQADSTAGSAAAAGFFEVMERGLVSLYYSGAAGRDAFYAGRATGPVVTLEKRVETVTLNAGAVNARKVSREVNLYRARLAELMGDCADMGLYIAQLPYGEKPLREAVRRYNACRGGGATASARDARPRAVLGLVAGGVVSQLRITTSFATDGGTAAGLSGGLSLRMPLSRRTTRTTLLLGLVYEGGSYRVDGKTSAFSARTVKREYKSQAAYLHLPVGVRYEFNGNKLKPFAQAGLGLGYLLSSDLQYRDELFSMPGTFTSWQPLALATRRLEQSAFGGVGLMTNRPGRRNFSLGLQLEFGNAFSGADSFVTSFRRLYTLVSYDLTK